MLNLYNEQLRLKAQMTCAYNAAHSGFKYLPIRFIINPPHQLPEAMLARQVAVHIMWNEFKIPRRRIASALYRQRTSISFNIQKINRRLQEPISRVNTQNGVRKRDLHMLVLPLKQA